MSVVKRVFISIVVCWLGMCAGVLAQGVSPNNDEVLPAPQDHVLDDTALFRERPELLSELRESLRRMEKEYGYSVYLAIYYNVYDGDIQGRADALYKAWVGEEGNGMVFVYQLDPVVDAGSNPVVAFFEDSVLESDISGEEYSGRG